MGLVPSDEKQRTIARDASYKGVGLHTGNKCRLAFHPAPPNTGVVFVRTDLPDKPRLPASYDIVSSVVRGTTLSRSGDPNDPARVHTVEHVLSAFYGLGIDNAVIEVDANEPPVADGSARPFADALLNAGIVEQDAYRRYFQPDPASYSAGETSYVVEPSDGLSFETEIDFPHPMIQRQVFRADFSQDTFLKEIAPARTFCFDYEVEALQRQGLARGGSLDNAVVVGRDRIHNKEKSLRFPDEFVRHKTLDLVGDLFLLGFRLKARIKAVRCGHGHNVNLVKQLAGQLAALAS